MKKLLLSAVIIVVVSISAFSQTDKKFSFSVGPELSLPTGSFNNTHSLGVGGSVQAEYYVMEKLKATATLGLLAYAGKKSVLLNPDRAAQRIVPLRIGAKYYLVNRLYGGAQLGVAFLSNYAQHSGTAFAYSPLMLGYEFNAGSGKSLDATIKYDAYTGAGGLGTIGTFGIRLAYVF
ncbi:MAG: hypothetical protein WKI04_07295 [Ferruginibacter sp.]